MYFNRSVHYKPFIFWIHPVYIYINICVNIYYHHYYYIIIISLLLSLLLSSLLLFYLLLLYYIRIWNIYICVCVDITFTEPFFTHVLLCGFAPSPQATKRRSWLQNSWPSWTPMMLAPPSSSHAEVAPKWLPYWRFLDMLFDISSIMWLCVYMHIWHLHINIYIYIHIYRYRYIII